MGTLTSALCHMQYDWLVFFYCSRLEVIGSSHCFSPNWHEKYVVVAFCARWWNSLWESANQITELFCQWEPSAHEVIVKNSVKWEDGDQLLLSVCTQEPTCYHPGICGNLPCCPVCALRSREAACLDVEVSFMAFPHHHRLLLLLVWCHHHLPTLKTRRKHHIHSGLCQPCVLFGFTGCLPSDAAT